MSESAEREVRELRSLYWSERDPEGRGFAPLADACRRAGATDDARALLDEGLERLPHFASGHIVAARLHLDLGDTHSASESLRHVLELDGDNAEALSALGAIRAEEGRHQEALELFKRLAVVSPGDPSVADRIQDLESSVDAGFHAESVEVGTATLEAPREGAALPSTPGADLESTPFEAPEPEAFVAEELAPEDAEPEAPVVDELALDAGELEAPVAEELAPEDAEPTTIEALAPDEAEWAPVDEYTQAPEPVGPGDLMAVDEIAPHADVSFATEDPGLDEEDPLLDEELHTRTLGELYADQRLYGRAVEVYRHLVEEEPGDTELRARLQELERLAREARIEEPEARSARSKDVGPVAISPPDEDLEALAAELGMPPEAEPELSTPFAWSEDEPDAEAVPPEEPASGQAVATPEPEPSVVSIDALAPDAAPVASIDALAPDALPGDPGSRTVPGALPLEHETILPDATETVMPIETLAPDAEPVVPIASLAPSDDRTDKVQQFQDWMNRLRQ